MPRVFWKQLRCGGWASKPRRIFDRIGKTGAIPTGWNHRNFDAIQGGGKIPPPVTLLSLFLFLLYLWRCARAHQYMHRIKRFVVD